MKLTKDFIYVKLDDNIYAIYNEKIEKVMFVNKNMLINIILNKNLEKKDKKKLKRCHIYENTFSRLKNKIKYYKNNKKFSNDQKLLKSKLQTEYLKLLLK